MIMRNSWSGFAAMGALILAGCATGPEYEQPDLMLPTDWPEEIHEQMDADHAITGAWWTLYDDPMLSLLIRQALANNADIETAAARVSQARAMLGFQRAERLPTLDGIAEAERENPGVSGSTGTELSLGALLSYELDLWGRLARAEEGARARLLESAFSHDAVRVAIISDVISTYFDYRAANEQIETTEATIGSLIEALNLEESRLESGASTELAVRQAQAELETSRAALPSLREAAQRHRRALAVLVGDMEQVISGLEQLDEGGFESLPDTTVELPEFMPSDLLLRRPDVRAAEAFLIATNADIGVARAQSLPSLNLSAFYGSTAAATSDLFTGSAEAWALTATGVVPVLDFGRRHADVQSAEAARLAAEHQYRATVQRAFQEVGDAWSVLEAAEERVRARQREIEARVEVVRLAERRYLGGYIPYLEVLDARRALLDARLTTTQAARDRMVATAMLFRALGVLEGTMISPMRYGEETIDLISDVD